MVLNEIQKALPQYLFVTLEQAGVTSSTQLLGFFGRTQFEHDVG